jgi:hypothetical protein
MKKYNTQPQVMRNTKLTLTAFTWPGSYAELGANRAVAIAESCMSKPAHMIFDVITLFLPGDER